jgi:hypothetical protein
MTKVVSWIVAMVFCIGVAEAAEVKKHPEDKRFLQNDNGYCVSKGDIARSCSGIPSNGNCNIAVKQPKGGFKVYYATAVVTPIADQRRRAQRERTFSYEDLTCVVKSTQIKAIQDCVQKSLTGGRSGIRAFCNVARLNKGRLSWHRAELTLEKDRHTTFVETPLTNYANP